MAVEVLHPTSAQRPKAHCECHRAAESSGREPSPESPLAQQPIGHRYGLGVGLQLRVVDGFCLVSCGPVGRHWDRRACGSLEVLTVENRGPSIECRETLRLAQLGVGHEMGALGNRPAAHGLREGDPRLPVRDREYGRSRILPGNLPRRRPDTIRSQQVLHDQSGGLGSGAELQRSTTVVRSSPARPDMATATSAAGSSRTAGWKRGSLCRSTPCTAAA